MERIDRLREILTCRQCEAVVLEKAENIRYFTGFAGDESCLFVSGDRAYILTDSRYTLQAGQESGVPVIETNDIPDTLQSLVTQGARILFEDRSALYTRYLAFSSFAQPVGLGSAVEELRQIKSDEEVACIAAAQRVTEQAFVHVLDYIRPGVTEMDLVCELEYVIKKQGCSLSFDTIVAFGSHAALPHAVPSLRRLALGENVLIDFGAKKDGYCSDMTRTVFCGTPSQQMREVYGTVLRAQQNAMERMRAGDTLAQADRYAREVIESAGYGPNFGHSLGHGIGLECHEAPRVSPRGEGVLQPGMVITVEPGIYLADIGGVRIENMCHVGLHSVSSLTQAENSLIII